MLVMLICIWLQDEDYMKNFGSLAVVPTTTTKKYYIDDNKLYYVGEGRIDIDNKNYKVNKRMNFVRKERTNGKCRNFCSRTYPTNM